MCLALKSKGIHCNPKTILRVMKKYDLLSEIRRRRKWVNMGQQLHRYENLLNRPSSAIKHTIHGDANITDDVSSIRNLMNMNYDIKR